MFSVDPDEVVVAAAVVLGAAVVLVVLVVFVVDELASAVVPALVSEVTDGSDVAS